MTDLAVLPLTAADEQRAMELARQLRLARLPPATSVRDCTEVPLVLIVDGARLALQRTGRNVPGAVEVDFGAASMRHRRRSGANELLGRAVGVGKIPDLRVLDATAGLGRDAFVLADHGCQVTLCERHPVIAQLLVAGHGAALREDDEWLQGVAQRMCICAGDARDCLTSGLAPDVIYLDPMFPPRGKTAAVGKEMALLQLLLQDDPSFADEPAGNVARDNGLLLEWALSRGAARVVVKRPLKAVHLGGSTPSHCIRGKAVRYDVYVCRNLQRD